MDTRPLVSKQEETESPSSPADCGEAAVVLAGNLLRQSLNETSAAEAAQMERVANMIGHPAAKSLSLTMTDRMHRSNDSSRVARMFRRLVDRYGSSTGFSLLDRVLLNLGSIGSRILPGVVVAAVRKRLRNESSGVILPAEDAALTAFLKKRRAAGSRININQLGEAVLGEDEAHRRFQALMHMLERDDVDYVSVKISAIFSQINLVAREQTLTAIKERLRPLYRSALAKDKFVNLDMEEYRDLGLTVAAFRELLDEPEFDQLTAGIVLQAYLPDSIPAQEELVKWAKLRVADGKAPIKMRLVKGANLAMERVEAELHGWRAAPHRSKHDTDACFKRMLEFGCCPENAAAVRLGVASHNLFDIALALVLRERNGVEEFVEIEMLEGMAPAQSRVVQKEAGSLLFYAPIVNHEEFGSALAYLIRRLDENTAQGNFLASLFSLRPGSPSWIEQRDRFLAAWQARHEVTEQSYRTRLPVRDPEGFSNEPDTDWTQEENRKRLIEACADVNAVPQSGAEEIETTLAAAREALTDWRTTPAEKRAALLRDCADQLAATRFQSIALLRDEGKKAPMEADTEVSEAIDFARYYAGCAPTADGIDAEPLGTVVVTPPWNFPFAIPCGGVLAALAAGNTVILKPAPESVRIGWWLVRQLWAAGIPRDVLQFVACSDGEVGRRLIDDPRTSAVILTGAYETADKFRSWRPDLRLFAETSGKNALVVSALADRELAAKDLIRSAFGHSGQKCSAASLGILEREVYEDHVFLRQLFDATASLAVGDASDPASIVTPLIQPPNERLLRALTTLDDGEEWLVKPAVSPDDPCLWSPGIKIGVKPGSWFHQNECFGPVLGLMCADDLDHAIEIQNAVEFGLTAGLHSLDEREIAHWKSKVEAGNLYINRGITGAIVQRQPFGGWKRSSIGPGAKAGGPNYVNLLRTLRDDGALAALTDKQIEENYREAWTGHFTANHDPAGLRCESNDFRYRPCRGVLLRLSGGNSQEDDAAERRARIAAEVTGVPLVISRANRESEAELISRLPQLAEGVEFFRSTGEAIGPELLRTVFDADLNWIDAPLVSNGRIELTRWTREQSVTETRHRYGNIPVDTAALR